MRIYTRGGDDGSTGLFGGRSVSKADPRVEAYGRVDEANAVLGWARAAGLPADVDGVLGDVQATCFRAGSWLASPDAEPGVPALSADDVTALERAIDDLEVDLPPLKGFIVPGGCEAAARLHVARTVVRRAERAIVTLAETQDVPDLVLPWVNRLSDLLFVAARAANHAAGVDDVPWGSRTT
jgi:cob(I)alamin adenosyltransferase